MECEDVMERRGEREGKMEGGRGKRETGRWKEKIKKKDKERGKMRENEAEKHSWATVQLMDAVVTSGTLDALMSRTTFPDRLASGPGDKVSLRTIVILARRPDLSHAQGKDEGEMLQPGGSPGPSPQTGAARWRP